MAQISGDTHRSVILQRIMPHEGRAVMKARIGERKTK
jgi:hypothetical protein